MPQILKRFLKQGSADHQLVFRDFAGVLERLIRKR